MATQSIAHVCAETVAILLDSQEIIHLISELDSLKWTGRRGYPTRTMLGVVFTKSLYGFSTWTRTISLIREHEGLHAVLGCATDDQVPSIDATYRFVRKLRQCEGQRQCIDAVLEALHSKNPEMGKDIAIDGSSMKAYAKGATVRYPGGPVQELTDPDASWGRRSAVSTRNSGTYFGYKLHAAVCSKTDLPLAWTISTAKAGEASFAAELLDEVKERRFTAETAAMDKGYDLTMVYEACAERGVLPVIPLRQTPGVKRGTHKPPTCEHGEWKFAGADRKREATKWRCPTGECKPASVWVKADRLHPLIPRETKRWKQLYRGRTAAEREFGHLKTQWALTPLRVRRIERVKLHADLTVLTKLAYELAKVRQSQESKV